MEKISQAKKIMYRNSIYIIQTIDNSHVFQVFFEKSVSDKEHLKQFMRLM